MGLKNTFVGLGLLGLLGAQEAQATELGKDTDVDRSQLTAQQARNEVLEKAIQVNYGGMRKEVFDYNGAVIVLFSSHCPENERGVQINRNMDIVYLGLMDKFADAKVNGLPLKFEFYDGCGDYNVRRLGVTTIETHMYLDGRELDVMKGGPTIDSGIVASVQNMSTWINYDLLGIKDHGDENLVVLYKGEPQLKVYSKSEINN